MTLDTPNKRLAHVREAAGYSTATEAARAFGWNENTYRSHENGERGLKAEIVRKYARAFHVSVSWILFGFGRHDQSNVIPLRGYINQDNSIYFKKETKNRQTYDVGAKLDFELSGDFFGIDTPQFVPDLTLLAKSLIIFRTLPWTISSAEGKLCLIEKEDGTFTVLPVLKGDGAKTIQIATRGIPPILEIQPKSLHLVYLIVPPGGWEPVEGL
ncbi:helix-turn-helix transcriptional regulator [Methylobacterium sp. 174MFSha1.1]|uniref:helix-turn-helix domain-containing protein n=1 Tax=Methylobacterium sp. 174MFSha1.1 TaxID=1502749 RepID=UPI000B8A392B|nr:helix-turn-helix transcriptional regulator [Methylobacterium sp. 174MFSha1.1]